MLRSMRLLMLFLWTLPFVWPAAIPAAGTEIYVSGIGSDADAGTKQKPLRSLEAARDMLRKLKKSGQVTGGSTVWLAGGIYHRSGAFELTGEDSGTEQEPNIYRSRPREEARLV